MVEFGASTKIEIENKLQIMTLNFKPKLNFELDNKWIFGSNLTLSETNIELSLNFEPARRSKLEKSYK